MRIWLFFLAIHGYAAFNLNWGVPAVSLDSNPPVGDTDMNAAIAVDPNGHAAAVWCRTEGQHAVQDVWAALYNHSSRVWTGAILISGGSNALGAQVAMDEWGNALFVWQEGFSSRIVSRLLTNTGVWEPNLASPPAVVYESSFPQELPQLAMDATGNALIIWMEYFGGAYHICSAKKPYMGDWVSLGELSNANSAVQLNTTKAVAMGKSGDAIAVWEEHVLGIGSIHAARFVSGNWSVPFQVSIHDLGSAKEPAVAIDNSGNSVVIWNQNQGIFFRGCKDSIWSSVYRLSDAQYAACHPDVEMDEMGNAVAVFERFDTVHKFICGTTLMAGSGEWSKPTDISPPSVGDVKSAGYPVLAVNEIGDGVVVWKEHDGTSMVIQGAGYSLGTWSVTRTLSTLGSHAAALVAGYDIDVSVNTAGNIMAIWPEDPTGDGSQQIKATYGVGIANVSPPPPIPDPFTLENGIASGFQKQRRFPAHLDLINVLSWSTSTPGAYYRIYRGSLSNLVGTSVEPKFEDHQRVPKQKETYLITAVDVNEQESTPMTLIVHPR